MTECGRRSAQRGAARMAAANAHDAKTDGVLWDFLQKRSTCVDDAPRYDAKAFSLRIEINASFVTTQNNHQCRKLQHFVYKGKIS